MSAYICLFSNTSHSCMPCATLLQDVLQKVSVIGAPQHYTLYNILCYQTVQGIFIDLATELANYKLAK